MTKIASDRRVLRTLSDAHHPQAAAIGMALARLRQRLPLADAERVARIEHERRRLLNRGEPLADGSLGEGGLYDRDKTVALACQVSKPPRPALLLYLLIRELRSRNVIELGTNVGISSAYLASALQANGTGRLTTLDASPYRQRLAREVHSNLGLRNVSYVNGLFAETLCPTLRDTGPVDLAFIDGHHQYQPTLAYMNEILSFAAHDAVLVFDDIRWSDGMKQAWADIRADRQFSVVIDLQSVGVCLRPQTPSASRLVLPPVHTAL